MNSKNDELPLDQAEPYRTPAEISEPTKSGLLASPIAWIGAIGLVVALAGMFLLAPTSSSGLNTIEYVEEFGATRAGPPIDDVDISEEPAMPPTEG